tara:strand:+ start:497 stop:865 length:369 start_codon:yes stop_codon:yes gene_type:complete
MWQLRKLSTKEPLSEAGPLPTNWGSIFGLAGIKDKIGDLSWIGPAYADMGWIKLSPEEELEILKDQVATRIEKEKAIANKALQESSLTVEQKIHWIDYLLKLDEVYLSADFDSNVRFPVRPE